MIKILVSDYDNTFYLSDVDIQINKKAVKAFRNNGNKFIIATGRSYLALKSKIEKYNIDYDFIIINHGATIIGKNNEIIYNFIIENEILNSLKKDLKIEEYNIEYLNYKSEKQETNVYFCCSCFDSRVDFSNNDLTKIAVVYNDNIDVSKLVQDINKKYPMINAYLVSKNMIEIISSNINKSKAISLLADYYNLDSTCIYTVGDGYSDISMIKDYQGYAMKNSVPELNHIAIKSVDSVSQLIYEIM